MPTLNKGLKLRDLMPALQNKLYFNYGGQGPLPNPSLEKIMESWRKIQELGPFTNKVWPYIYKEIESTKIKLGEICGTNSNRIALTENVTSGCLLALWGLPLNQGEEILISDCEHPGIISGCFELARRKDLKVKFLKVQRLREGVENAQQTENDLIQELEENISSKTRLVLISHILWNTGQNIPIDIIAKYLKTKKNSPYLIIDGAQSFGQIPINKIAGNVDIYAFTGHKWACGAEGLGGVALSNRIVAESRPTLAGWRGLKNENHIDTEDINIFHADARKFEIATSCIPLLAGLRCSLDLLEKEDFKDNRLSKITEMSSSLWKNLTSSQGVKTILKGPPSNGLVSFYLTNKSSNIEVVKLLGQKKIWIRDLYTPPCLRACIHITTTNFELQKLITAIRQIAK